MNKTLTTSPVTKLVITSYLYHKKHSFCDGIEIFLIFFSLEYSDIIYNASKVHVKLAILAPKLQIILPAILNLDSSF